MKWIAYPLAVVPVFVLTLILLAIYGEETAAEFVTGVKAFFDSL